MIVNQIVLIRGLPLYTFWDSSWIHFRGTFRMERRDRHMFEVHIPAFSLESHLQNTSNSSSATWNTFCTVLIDWFWHCIHSYTYIYSREHTNNHRDCYCYVTVFLECICSRSPLRLLRVELPFLMVSSSLVPAVVGVLSACGQDGGHLFYVHLHVPWDTVTMYT